jgi:hypothetical protein
MFTYSNLPPKPSQADAGTWGSLLCLGAQSLSFYTTLIISSQDLSKLFFDPESKALLQLQSISSQDPWFQDARPKYLPIQCHPPRPSHPVRNLKLISWSCLFSLLRPRLAIPAYSCATFDMSMARLRTWMAFYHCRKVQCLLSLLPPHPKPHSAPLNIRPSCSPSTPSISPLRLCLNHTSSVCWTFPSHPRDPSTSCPLSLHMLFCICFLFLTFPDRSFNLGTKCSPPSPSLSMFLFDQNIAFIIPLQLLQSYLGLCPAPSSLFPTPPQPRHSHLLPVATAVVPPPLPLPLPLQY